MTRFDPLELGPGSPLWRYAGDNRLSFVGLSAGILQLMHTGLGAGVAEHSAFFSDPWDRIVRSVPEIIGVVYDPDAETTGRRVRNHHRRIKGVDSQGRPYSALEPGTFWWAHATFQWAVEAVADRFDARGLDGDAREQLYRDGVEWYRRYDVSMDPVPPDRSAFGEEFERVCAEELEMTPAAERAVDMALHDKVDDMPGLPWWSVPIQREVLTPVLKLTAIGGLPPLVRRRFDIPWRPHEAVELALLETWIRATWPVLPSRYRWAPRAAQGRRHAARRAREASMHRRRFALDIPPIPARST